MRVAGCGLRVAGYELRVEKVSTPNSNRDSRTVRICIGFVFKIVKMKKTITYSVYGCQDIIIYGKFIFVLVSFLKM